MKSLFIISTILLIIALTEASPKKYNNDEGNFQPSNRYYESNLPSANNQTYEAKKDSDRLRYGLPLSGYGSTGNGAQYGSNNGMGYVTSPMKIDIGGIALGAIVGLSMVLILPKLANVFSGGHGYRSLENEMSSLTQTLARIDDSLELNNIDSSSCMQRVICTYVNDAKRNTDNGEGNSVDEFVVTLANNGLFSYMLDGSSVKQAIDLGKQAGPEKCAELQSKCPISREKVLKVIMNLLPA